MKYESWLKGLGKGANEENIQHIDASPHEMDRAESTFSTFHVSIPNKKFAFLRFSDDSLAI